MPVDEKTREALDLDSIRSKAPASIPLLDLEVEDYVDSTGEPSLRILVVIDESTDIENVSGIDVGELKFVIRESLRNHGVQLFPYFTIAKPSELQESNYDDED